MARLIPKAGDIARRSLWHRIKDVALADVGVLARGGVKAGDLERLEALLLEADFGVSTTLQLVAEVERLARRGEVKSDDEFREALRRLIEAALRAGHAEPSLAVAAGPPTVILVIGVNGAGKTTFIGKLAARYRREGKTVLVGAADTFRAGAHDQLKVWADRAGVAFDAMDAGVTRGADVVIIDTAGRLHTSDALMEELRKVVRVVKKRLPDAPHETLLVLDGTIGQNALAQAKIFTAVAPVTGLVVTKLDGTARGGIVVAVHTALDVPVKFLGTGESADDLAAFDAAAFSRELLEA